MIVGHDPFDLLATWKQAVRDWCGLEGLPDPFPSEQGRLDEREPQATSADRVCNPTGGSSLGADAPVPSRSSSRPVLYAVKDNT